MKCWTFNICWDDVFGYSGLTQVTTKVIGHAWSYNTNQSTHRIFCLWRNQPFLRFRHNKFFTLSTQKMVSVGKFFMWSKINIYKWKMLRMNSWMYWKLLLDIIWMNTVRSTLCDAKPTVVERSIVWYLVDDFINDDDEKLSPQNYEILERYSLNMI